MIALLLIAAMIGSPYAKERVRSASGQPVNDVLCELDIECPPDVRQDCKDPIDPDQLGYPYVEGSDPPFDMSHEDTRVPGDCCGSYTIERLWTVTDAAGNVRECTQTIVIIDDTPPTIRCGEDRRIPCTEPVVFDTPVAVDDCDPNPEIVLKTSSISIDPETCEQIHARGWVAVDACGNESEPCYQTIYKAGDTEAPVISCPPDIVTDCSQIDDLGEATAVDNCDPDPDITYEDEYIFYRCPWEFIADRTWTATDECGNSSSCVQRVEVQDSGVPEILYCPPDTVISADTPISSLPHAVAVDDCNPDLEMIYEVARLPERSECGYWIIRSWEWTDGCCNKIGCSQRVEICDEEEMCSYTKGGWGSGCPGPQQGDSMSTQPGCMRDHYFDQVFPSGVTVGDHGGGTPYGALWTSAEAVELYLPSGGPPSQLTEDLVNPTSTPAGNLAAQLLALTLNREYSCAGIWEHLGLTEDATCYGTFVIPASCGKFAGLTVDQFLAIANQAVGGDTDVLISYDADLSDVNDTADCLNNLYNVCDADDAVYVEEVVPHDLLTGSGPAQGATDRPESESKLPDAVRVSSHPNPLTKTTTISYAVPADARVAVAVYDIQGKLVSTLFDAQQTAGSHEVIWDGSDRWGAAAVSGVYFCRVQVDGRPAVMDKLIKF
jgi:hypothetical protein